MQQEKKTWSHTSNDVLLIVFLIQWHFFVLFPKTANIVKTIESILKFSKIINIDQTIEFNSLRQPEQKTDNIQCIKFGSQISIVELKPNQKRKIEEIER